MALFWIYILVFATVYSKNSWICKTKTPSGWISKFLKATFHYSKSMLKYWHLVAEKVLLCGFWVERGKHFRVCWEKKLLLAIGCHPIEIWSMRVILDDSRRSRKTFYAVVKWFRDNHEKNISHGCFYRLSKPRLAFANLWSIN